MPIVTATACTPRTRYIETREITDDLPADVIGEAVTEAVNRAWKAGNDPTGEGFVVTVRFSVR